MKPRVLLVGANRANHFGCQLVADILVKAFNPTREIPAWDKAVAKHTKDIDFVVVNAEGSTHHDRNKHLYRDFHRPAVLINAVWQCNSVVDLSHFLYVSTRESLSAQAMSECGVEPQVVPDVMLSQEFEIGSGGGLIVSDTVSNRMAGVPVTQANLSTFLCADKIVCGRFHAACLAIATGKPFSCYPSNTWKTEGMMRDAGLRNYYKTKNEAVAMCPVRSDLKAAQYLIEARQKIQVMIEHVRGLILNS